MDRETEALLLITARALRFATDHPYAATGIFGAAVGSAITYQVMAYKQKLNAKDGILTPKFYKIVLPADDVQHLLDEPTTELRWETSDVSVLITSEERIPLKQLPVITVNAVD